MRERAEAIEHFAAVLRELRNSVGNPSFREMSGRSRAISHATLHEATRGNRLPSWATTVEFVKACGGEPEAFRERWEKANLTVRSVTTGGHPIVDIPADGTAEDTANAAAGSTGHDAANSATHDAANGIENDAANGDGNSIGHGVGNGAADEAFGEALGFGKGRPSDGPAGEIQASDQLSGEVLLADGGGAVQTRQVEPIAGDVLLAVPATERRGRFRLTRPLTAVFAAGAVGTVVICAVAFTRGSFAPAGHDLNPSGATAEAAQSCPVKAPQPSDTPPAHDGDESIFVADVTLSDCTHVPAGKTVTKVWRLKNIGTVPWKGYSLVRLDLPQHPDQCQTATNIPINDTRPGELVDISTDVVTPGKAGLCYLRFKMLDATGTVAFPGKRPVNLQIIVDEP
ncbi:NBR1-Ig-like domain-containing protein [Actinomadura oligospora]|uniref:NBR1-Ig-like domain-containing protein n=1 Tax=Actinomadura oligospora TaxID=111804 RepID=UPI0006883540|nr:NBR1-Ig-like domain-containing protein [Actinomadura oligospora]